MLDPKNFQDIDETISHKAFERLSELITRFDSNAMANSKRLRFLILNLNGQNYVKQLIQII